MSFMGPRKLFINLINKGEECEEGGSQITFFFSHQVSYCSSKAFGY